ncbi:MAG: cyclase family protein [Chloroflexota bacterium]
MIYDISLPISPDLPVWPGDPNIVLEQVAAMDDGAEANVTRLDMSAHTGTHVDAPHHFMNDGRTVENLSLEALVGECYVLRVANEIDEITADILEKADIPKDAVRLLFRTRNSELWRRGESRFQTGFAAVSEDGARWLVERGVKLVGVDYLSVAAYSQPVPTHRALLAAGVVVVEGLDLSRVEPGVYVLYCLPLKLVGADGAPARAILVG